MFCVNHEAVTMQFTLNKMSRPLHSQITIPTASQLDSSTIRQLQQLQQFLIRQTESSGPSAGPSTSAAHLPDSVKFNKKLLDYDYDEDDDDDNKQLSPRGGAGGSNNEVIIRRTPITRLCLICFCFLKIVCQYLYFLRICVVCVLVSTFNNTTFVYTFYTHTYTLTQSNSISKLLNDPTVLRQLQTLQKLKQQEEKQSKLTKMQMQEEAFEKHLATVLKVNIIYYRFFFRRHLSG